MYSIAVCRYLVDNFESLHICVLIFKFVSSSYDLLLAWKSRWKDDGLNSLDSLDVKVLSRSERKLFTNITVDVGQAPLSPPDVSSHVSYHSFIWSAILLCFFDYPLQVAPKKTGPRCSAVQYLDNLVISLPDLMIFAWIIYAQCFAPVLFSNFARTAV